MSEAPIKIIVSDAVAPNTILLVPTHPLTAEELEQVRAMVRQGWNELSAVCELRARQSAAIKVDP